MGLLNLPTSDIIFDPIRKTWVKKTPEEIIRQKWMALLIKEGQFPSSLFAVEKQLCQLPHLINIDARKFPKRRVDLLAYFKKDQALTPLLLLECKACPITPRFARQVVGYNHYVNAPFVALANAAEMLVGAYDVKKGYFHFEKLIPNYHILLSKLSRA